MSLGIYNRLWNLLEEACHKLDFNLATCDVSASVGASSSSGFSQLSLLRVELEAQKNLAAVLSDMLTFITLTVEDPCNNPVYDSLKEDVDKAQKLICDKVISTNPKIKNIYYNKSYIADYSNCET